MKDRYNDRLRVAVGHTRRVAGLFPGEKTRLCDLSLVRCPVTVYSACKMRPQAQELKIKLQEADNHPGFSSNNPVLIEGAVKIYTNLDKQMNDLVLPSCDFEKALGQDFDAIAREKGIY